MGVSRFRGQRRGGGSLLEGNGHPGSAEGHGSPHRANGYSPSHSGSSPGAAARSQFWPVWGESMRRQYRLHRFTARWSEGSVAKSANIDMSC